MPDWLPWLVPGAALLLVAWYAAVLLRRLRAWRVLAEVMPLTEIPAELTFSVIVAARDEETQLPALLRALAAQRFPPAQFEVIVADDHSVDGTVRIVTEFAATAPIALRLLRLADQPGAGQGKKAALAAAIEGARHDWVACTDADCLPGPYWLSSLAAARRAHPALDLLSGPVALAPDGTFSGLLQRVEFAGLVGIGAASLALGEPNMCNGANLAYRVAAWRAVGGHSSHAHVASGDDEFLLHALWARRPGSAAFVRSQAALVLTTPAPTVRTFLRQRIRWASKWRHYRQPGVRGMAAGVFLTNALLLLGAGGILAWPATAPVVVLGWVSKLAVDYAFLRTVGAELGVTRGLRRAVLTWQVLYMPYVVGTALASLSSSYEWKGRTHSARRKTVSVA